MSETTVNSGILSDVGIGAEKRDELSLAFLPGGLFACFKAAFGPKISKIFFIGFLNLIFVAPAIAWVIVALNLSGNISEMVPYSALDGIGYVSPTAFTEGLNSATIIGNMLYFKSYMLIYSVLVACAPLAAIGLGGMAYVARVNIWGGNLKIFRHYFRGIKYSWLPAIISGLIEGAAVLLVVFNLYAFDAYGGGVAGKVFGLIGSITLLIFTSMFMMYALCLSTTYKMPLGKLLKDSVCFTFGAFFKNLFAIIFGSLVVWVMILVCNQSMFADFVQLIWMMVFAFGLHYVISIFTVYAHASFDKYINATLTARLEAIESEQKAAERKADQERLRKQKKEKKNNSEEKPKQQVHYSNPKKKRKRDAAEAASGGNSLSEKSATIRKGGYTAEELKQLEEDRQAAAASVVDTKDFDTSAFEDSE